MKVDVQEVALVGLSLDLTDEDDFGLALDVKVDQSSGAGRSEQLLEGVYVHLDFEIFGIASVDDAGHFAFPSETAGRAFAGLGPLFCVDA